jgi:SAM-dependent methyltransferase
MKRSDKLPESYLEIIKALEVSYLESDDPIRQSGFGGGPERWRAERKPILGAIESDGDLMDIGCANGYLLECMMEWGAERGLELVPHGLDIGSRLIDLAKNRFPEFASNFHVGNAWDWKPPRQYRYVYSVCDSVPMDYLDRYVARVIERIVEPGGRLILGAYGSRSQGRPPFDVVAWLESRGYDLVGSAEGGEPPIALFAWTDRSR